MEQKKNNGHGGARPGAGRPKGSSNKVTMELLLESLDKSLGRPYHEQLADNYVQAVNRSDWSGVRDYDRVFLGKVVADKQEVEVITQEDAIATRAAAFAEAMAALSQNTNKE